MKPLPIIFVPLDGSMHSLDALPVARTLARMNGATIHVLHIGERTLPPAELLEKLGLNADDLEGSVLRQGLGDAGEQISQAASEERDAIVVMCTHAGAPTVAGGVLGRVAARVLLDAGCPVVFVRPERGTKDWRLRDILVAHDGTPTTTVCICPAAQLARDAGARLSVLHVAASTLAPPPKEPGSLTAPKYVDQPQHEWPSWAGEFTDRLMTMCPIDPSTLRLTLVSGEPGPAVVRFAREHDVDLIVVAWRGSLEAERAAVVKAALGGAPCPIMVLRVASPD